MSIVKSHEVLRDNARPRIRSMAASRLALTQIRRDDVGSFSAKGWTDSLGGLNPEMCLSHGANSELYALERDIGIQEGALLAVKF